MTIVFFENEEWEIPYLKEKLSQHQLIFEKNSLTDKTLPLAKTADIISVFIYSQLTEELLKQLPNVKYITTRSTGYDHIDLSYCQKKNINVSNVPEYGTHTVAEHTFALILAITRNLIPSVNRARQSNFSLDGLKGSDLYEKTIGVIGVGNIGRAVIAIAKGFGMSVQAYTKNPDFSLEKELGCNFVDFKTLLSSSDIITLHVPYNKETHHMINQETVRLCKKGSILINTARGGIVETGAILTGLEEHIFHAVGIDVLEEECRIKEERQLLTSQFLKECDIKTQLLNHVLLTRDDVIVTPHNAFNSYEALKRILEVTLENIMAFLQDAPKNCVTPSL